MSSSEEPFALRGRVLLGSDLVDGAVIVRDGVIVEVVREPHQGNLPRRVHDGHLIAPGLIDLQVNGAFGAEVDARPESLRHIAARLPSTGVTAYLPTLVSSPPGDYPPVFDALRGARGAPGAEPLGLHLEGPFLSPARVGAHKPAVITSATLFALEPLFRDEAVRLVTLAPEREGALGWITRLSERGVLVSLGHTDATYETFVRGLDAGATMATHLYNAMSPFGHRAPGAIGAALLDERVTVGLIADGVHCHPASARLALRAKGPERIALVTDAMAAAGMGPGSFELAGQRVTVDATSARLADGTLAGSVLTLDQAVRNAIAFGGANVTCALRMATEVPARLLGLGRKGRIAPGTDADLVVLDPSLHVEATFTRGAIAYARDRAATAR